MQDDKLYNTLPEWTGLLYFLSLTLHFLPTTQGSVRLNLANTLH
jgi:hypothetical protein